MNILDATANTNVREALREIFRGCSLDTMNPVTSGAEQYRRKIAEGVVDLLVLDYGANIDESATRIRVIRALLPNTPILVITLYDDVEETVSGAKCACFDYRRNQIWSPAGMRLAQEAADEARRLVA